MSDTSVKIVIDGYNLLHQSPWMKTGSGPMWLHQQRLGLVQILAKLLTADERQKTLCIFDAHTDRSPNTTDFVLHDIRVRFAHLHREADDYIEDLIYQHPQPTSLQVISSDRRIQRTATHLRATATDCRHWLDTLLTRQVSANHALDIRPFDPEEVKNSPLEPTEIGSWLQALDLGDLSQPISSPTEKGSPKPVEIKSKKRDRRALKKASPAKTSPAKTSKPASQIAPPDEIKIDPAALRRANRKLPDGGPIFPDSYLDDFS